MPVLRAYSQPTGAGLCLPKKAKCRVCCTLTNESRQTGYCFYFGVIWGAAFLSVRIALEGAPITVAAMRVLVGSAALVVMGSSGQGLDKVPGARGWAFASAIGLGAIALPFTWLAWGQQFVPSAYAGVAMGSVPLLVLPLVAIFSPEEGIGPRRIMGLILGFAGIAVLFGPEALSSDAVPVTDRMLIWGTAACVGAASCYAIGSIITRRAPAMPPISLAAATLVVAAIALVPLALWFEGVPDAWPTRPTYGCSMRPCFRRPLPLSSGCASLQRPDPFSCQSSATWCPCGR